jgi:hypothetical protein
MLGNPTVELIVILDRASDEIAKKKKMLEGM